MRELTDAQKIEWLMALLGAAAAEDGVCYFTGGASAVLLGWRSTTVDIDIALDPASDELYRAITRAKEELRINVEIASPGEFVPLPGGWRERARSVRRVGKLAFSHFDLYSQALAKLERGHTRDLEDVRAMLDRDLIDSMTLLGYFQEIEPQLFRYPAIDPRSFRREVENAL